MRRVVWIAALLALGAWDFDHGNRCTWEQWGGGPTHDGEMCVAAQPAVRTLGELQFDPFADAQMAETGGVLLTHYQSALTDDDDNVFMMHKGGVYVSCDPPGSGEPFPCGPDAIESQVWEEKGLQWRHGQLRERWTFASDYKVPLAQFFEPTFQPALWGPFIYVPGAGGTVWQVLKLIGLPIRRINPFPDVDAQHRYVAGGVTTDRLGNVYWNVIQYDEHDFPQFFPAHGFLVKATVFGTVHKVSYSDLIPGAPAEADLCFTQFPIPPPPTPRPVLPPPPGVLPPQAPCGAQRPGLNALPAVAPDGTIYTVSRAHFNGRYSYIVALKPNLSLKWATSMRGLENDACGVLLPSTPRQCPPGTTPGVEPRTNLPPAFTVDDSSSSVPVAVPDGVVYGALDGYNFARGHLVKLRRDGSFVDSYTFGWDITPAVYRHGGSYSLIVKDNNYVTGGPFYITQLSADLQVEWQYADATTDICDRLPDGTVECHPPGDDEEPHDLGYEWCINSPAVDADGNVFVTSEDGYFYGIAQGGVVRDQVFLDINDGAAYTPLSLDRRGRIYALNNGKLTVLGNH